MKKITCLLLSLVLLLSTAGCRKEAAPNPPAGETVPASTAAVPTTETEVTVPETTEPNTWTVEDAFLFDAEASLAENSKTVTYKTPKEYEKALHKLGFTEYRGDLYRPTLFSPVATLPTSLTYNEEVFRLDFDYLDLADPDDFRNLMAELRTVTGCSLYGVKNAPGIANISGYRREDFTCADSFDITYNPEVFYQAEFAFYNLENDLPTCLITSSAYYYPGSGNLYNLVQDHENPLASYGMPHVLCTRQEDFDNPGLGYVKEDPQVKDLRKKMRKGTTSLYQMRFQYGYEMNEAIYEYHPDGYMYTYYDGEMTIRDWHGSKFAHNHDWTLSLDKNTLIYLPVGWDVERYGMYGITDLDRKIADVITMDENGFANLILLPLGDLGLTLVPG